MIPIPPGILAARLDTVIVESPYAGDIELNTAYARACLLDCFSRNEAPFASHLLYPQVLDEAEPEGRALGIAAGLRIGTDILDSTLGKVVFYEDLGWSPGMHAADEFYRGYCVASSLRYETERRRLSNFDKWLEGYRASHVMPELARNELAQQMTEARNNRPEPDA